MERLMQPDQLHTRILLWAEEEIRLGHLLPNSGGILEAVVLSMANCHVVSTLPEGPRRTCDSGSEARRA